MLAIIGGSGFAQFPELEILGRHRISTPYGEASDQLVQARLRGFDLVFLPRHGAGHKLPPHLINYRANIWALKQFGVSQIIAVNAVGGISSAMAPQMLVVPNQIIDYTYGREQSFNFLQDNYVNHIDFTEPYSSGLCAVLKAALKAKKLPFVADAVYGCMQGPRLETKAEIRRLARDGCDIVGMTAMPEAALARELELEYAALCLVVNWAAGVDEGEISLAAIMENLNVGVAQIKTCLQEVVTLLSAGNA
jgi:5'-methylthioinosine phosphorylase